jgi:hypothetical protein
MRRRGLFGAALIATLLLGALVAPTQAATSSRPFVAGYTQYTGPIYPLMPDQRPYTSSTVTPVGGFGLVDSTGVRMVMVGGKLHNHPVNQGLYALVNLNSYRLTGNTAYLDIAERNAQRLIDTHVESEGAWYFPYDFDSPVAGDTSEEMRAPWFSGMAQGRALNVFARLYEATRDDKWLTAADATFLSMELAPNGTDPYGVYVDGLHRLWLEEYPRIPPSTSENVLNGHISAIFGLLDYWQVTGNSSALTLARGAISTVLRTAMTGFRRANAMSVYSLRGKQPSKGYHQTHVQQMLMLYAYTHDPAFARIAFVFRNDYPKTTVHGTMQVTRRTSLIYRADAKGRILGSKRVTFTRLTSAPVDQRLRLRGGPIALRVSSGPYQGWYFPETFDVTWLVGPTNTHDYLPAVRVYVDPGTYTAYKLGPRGTVIATKTVRITRRTSAPSTRSAFVRGRACYYFASGTFGGYWVPSQKGVGI